MFVCVDVWESVFIHRHVRLFVVGLYVLMCTYMYICSCYRRMYVCMYVCKCIYILFAFMQNLNKKNTINNFNKSSSKSSNIYYIY